jgi:ectoine hydroxylase-related dioxygenase (phytanoyl-CoA dioxygenase family)
MIKNKNKNLIKTFKRIGLVKIEKLLTKKNAINLKKKLVEIYFDNKKKNMLDKNAIKQVDINNEAQAVHNLHNKKIEFVKLMSNYKVLRIVENLLKESTYKKLEEIICQKSFARNPSFNKKKQPLHTDSRFIASNNPLTINVFWLLDDFTKLNGALRIVPGSHKFLKFPKNNKKYVSEKIVEGKRGDVLIFDGNVWHGNSAKIKNEDRWVIAFRFTPWFYRPSFQNEFNTPIKLFNKMNDKEKTLLGFRHIPPKNEFIRVGSRSKVIERPKNFKNK